MIKRISKKKTDFVGEVLYKYKKNIININDLYNMEVNDNVFALKDIEVRSYFICEELKYELIFEKEGKLYASPSDYEKYIINIKQQTFKIEFNEFN